MCNVVLGKGCDQTRLNKEGSITIYIHEEADLMLRSYLLGFYFLVSRSSTG